MKRIAILLLCWCASAFVVAQDFDLSEQVQQVLAEENLVGTSWALVDGQQVTLGSAGFANKATNTVLLPSHKLHVGSITKTVLASGVLVMVSAGELSLDDKVTDLLAGIEFDNPWQSSHPVLVRHLLDHTSGLQDARFWHLFNTAATADSPLQQIFEIEPELLKVRTVPGSQFGYSNLSFNLLAMVVEALSGERYEDALATRLLKPLGMNDSSFHYTSQSGDGFDARLAHGHLDRGDLIGAIPGYLRAAGQFTTTPGDMVVFMQFLLGEGNGLILPQLFSQMGQVAATDSQLSGLNVGGSHGLWRRDRHGVVGLCHGGNTLGFRGMLCVFPSQHKGFFAMVNADSETADYGRIDQLMITALDVAKAKVPPLLRDVNTTQLQPWAGWYQPVSFGFESFAYLDLLFGLTIVSQLDDKLLLRSSQREQVTLTAVEDDLPNAMLFSASNRTTPSHIFTKDAQGDPVLSSGFISYKKADVLPLAILWLSLVAGLLGAIYIFFRGAYVLVKQPLKGLLQPVGLAFLMYVGFLLPLPFLFSQSFLQLGDINLASVLLAVVSGLSTLFCFAALVVGFKYRKKQKQNRLDAFAILAFLQWSLVLWYWGLLPFALWQI